eukprot:1157220-Pelagomonas_calceolata.AAC.3
MPKGYKATKAEGLQSKQLTAYQAEHASLCRRKLCMGMPSAARKDRYLVKRRQQEMSAKLNAGLSRARIV